MTDIPAGAISRTGCDLLVDEQRPATVLAQLTWSPRGAGQGHVTAAFVTLDAGASWRLISPAQRGALPDLFAQVATRGPTTYVIRQIGVNNAYDVPRLWASADGLRTWRRADLVLPPHISQRLAMTFRQFW